ncbi:MAG: hypothetical protein OEY14_14950 [Myxococcales bacterium]|nr:hypothetical protein [Myxococcales bacterium]
MLTIILIAAGAGLVLGAGLGFRAGRGYERLRPRKNTENKKKKSR